MNNKTILNWIAFDADDTLWKNEESYLEGREIFLEILEKYGVEIEDNEYIDQIEVSNIQYYGYGAMSFVLSLIEVAIKLTDERIHPGDIQLLLDHGKRMLSGEVEVFDGVKQILETLVVNHNLMLITKGDLFHQQRKIKKSGLEFFFQAVEVVSDKTPDVYLDILERHHIHPDHFLMVGNSLRSDIIPVLRLGGWAVFLKGHLSWSHEDDPLDDKYLERFLEVENISQVLEVISDINKL